jgi:ornithine cyclodeaminase
MTGVGTRWLADAGADDMALIGTGTQAITQVAAINAVRPLRRLRVWSPTAEKRRAFTEQVRQQFGFAVVESATLEAATKDAQIVTLVTRAKDPFLRGGMLARGAHLNAVGAILPANAEFHQDVFDRADLIAVDDVTGARRASREFMDRFGSDEDAWSKVRPIGELVANDARRPAGCDVTLFKAMGMGLSDLSVAIMALERAREQGIGRSIAHPVRAVPRWNATPAAAAPQEITQ